MYSDTLGQNSRVERQATFITKTYQHLLMAILAFVAVEYLLFSTGVAHRLAPMMMSVNWLFILGGFMVVSYLASNMAAQAASKNAQYGALGVYVIANALLFIPLLFQAEAVAPGAIKSAGIVTAAGFTGLTAIAFQTRKDFSFLGGMLRWGGLLAIGLIVAGALGFMQLGTWFVVAMIAYSGGAILYKTSQIIGHYPEERYVSASLELFAAITLMLWYVVQYFIPSD